MSKSENRFSFKNHYKRGNKVCWCKIKRIQWLNKGYNFSTNYKKKSKLCNECLLCVTERTLFDRKFHELPQSTLRMTVNASASKEYINFSFYFDKNFVCEHILKILLSYLVCTTKLLTSNRYAQN